VQLSRLSILLLLFPVALVAACNRGAHPRQLNMPAPDFTVSDGATSVHLAAYRGHPVLLTFWWSNCAPCIEEMPSLLQLHRDMPNLVILAVSIDDDASAYSAFLARHHVDLITVRDPSQSAPKLFHTDMWPETYAINQQGYIERKFVGAQDWSSPEIRSFLKNL
jgi:cytochrome c biogenesis protein CcmG, thiol:disulfide interchange protein DsbE